MDLREQFVLRAKSPGTNVTELALEFGVSRKTAYKWLARYDEGGVDALHDMSRRPRRVVQTTGEVVLRIIELRRAHPRWGPKKLRELLRRGDARTEPPSLRTIDRILTRLGEARVRRPRPRRNVGDVSTPATPALKPNAVWTLDFKGWWLTARTRDRCEPLTIRDAASRYLFELRLLPSTKGEEVKVVLERLFQQFGIPDAVRSDNGSPFGSTRAPSGLTKLTAWIVSLGIEVQFSRPACPQDNGGHERMHRDVRAEVQSRPAETLEAQQHACDLFRDEFNLVRPHEALGMKTPASVYERSTRPFRGPRPARYPFDFEPRLVDANGSIKLSGRRYFVGGAFAKQLVGTRLRGAVADIWFYEIELGQLDMTSGALAPPLRALTKSTAKIEPTSAAPRRKNATKTPAQQRGAVLVAESAPKPAHSTPEPKRRGRASRTPSRVTPSQSADVTSSRIEERRSVRTKGRKKNDRTRK